MLILKVGCLVRCLADIRVDPHKLEGVLSGTLLLAVLRVLRLKVTVSTSTVLVRVTVETVPSDPGTARVRFKLFIPRFKFQLKTGSMTFGRIQFPLCLAHELGPSRETTAATDRVPGPRVRPKPGP